jgi:hypothetical protein
MTAVTMSLYTLFVAPKRKRSETEHDRQQKKKNLRREREADFSLSPFCREGDGTSFLNCYTGAPGRIAIQHSGGDCYTV